MIHLLVNIFTDIPEHQFLSLIHNSSLVALPLDTDAPAGLIVIFQAAASEKMVITTKTASTEAYINDEFGCLLPNIVDDWVAKIQFYLCNSDLAIQKASKFHQYLLNECNEHKYAEIVSALTKNR